MHRTYRRIPLHSFVFLATALLLGAATSAQASADKATSALMDKGDLAAAARALGAADSGLEHEVAAWLAEAHGDVDAVFAHWLAAAADEDYDARRLALQKAADVPSGRAEKLRLAELAESLVDDADPDVASQARWTAIETRWGLGDVDRARQLRDEAGIIQKWQAIAGFENEQMKGFDVAYPPESEIDLDGTYPGQLREVGWRLIDQIDELGFVPHLQLQTPNEWSIGYLATWVKSPDARTLQLRVSSAEPVRAWVNGELVLSERYIEWTRPDHLVVPVSLDAGWNLLLVKSCQDQGDWLTRVRLADSKGRPATDLEFSTSPQRVRLRQGGAPPEAKAYWTKQVEQRVKGHKARRPLLRAYTLYKEGFVKEASNAFDGVVKAQPKSPIALLLAANAALESGEEEKALQRYAEGVEKWPGMPRFWLVRTVYFLDRGRLDRALQDLEALLKLAPKSEEARRLEVRLYRDKGWGDEACSVLEQLAADFDDHTAPWRGLARCSRDRGRYHEMSEHYAKVLELEPTDLTALDELASFALWRDEFGAAEKYWKQGRAYYPDRTQPHMELAEIYRRARRWDEAEAAYRKATELDPEYAYPYKELGEMSLERDQENSALEWWRQALERNPDDHALWERVELHEQDAAAPYLALVPTDAEIDEVVAGAAKAEVAQGASHVFLLDDEITAVNADGSVRRVVTHVARIEDEQGRDLFSSMRLPGGGRTRVLKAYSVGPDGQRVEVSSLRDGWVRFQDLKPGSVFVVQYRHDQGRSRFLQNHWASTWRFQQTNGQTARARWVAFVPKERELAVFRRGDIKETIEENATSRIYTWTAENVPPLLPEPVSPPAGDLLWTVQVSTVPSWEFIARWEWAMVEDALRQTPDLPELTAKIVSKNASVAEKIDAVYRYAARDIRYEQDYAEPIEGVRPHQCSVIVERGYGDCKDKTVVMMTLLEALGVEARFAMLSTATAGDAIKEVPGQQFNHAIVYVPAQEGFPEGKFFDPTAETLDMGNLRWDDQGQLALVLWESGYEFIQIPYDTVDKEHAHFDITLKLPRDPSELTEVNLVVTARGRWASGLRRTLRNEETGRKLVEGLGGGLLFVGADLVDYELSGIDDIVEPVKIQATYQAPNVIAQDGEKLRVEIEEFLKLALQQARWPQRRYPLTLGPPTRREVTVRFEAPAGYQIGRMPPAAAIEDPCLKFHLDTDGTTDRTGRIHYFIDNLCPQVNPDQYGDFRATLVSMTRAFSDRPLLTPEN